MPAVRYELVIPQTIATSREDALSAGWTLIAALRLRLSGEFMVPALADHSWDTIEGADANSCTAQLLEDAPRSRRAALGECVASQEDGIWVFDNFLRLLELRGQSQFSFALECLSGSQTETDYRMMTAKLWAGIEALVDVNQELRFRLAMLLAGFLEAPGNGRVARYRRILALYDVRSKVIHGGATSDGDLRAHVLEVRALLGRYLIAIVERGRMPAREQLESHLLGVPLDPDASESDPPPEGS